MLQKLYDLIYMKTKGFYYIIILFLIIGTVNAQTIDSSMVLIPGGEFLMGKDSERGFDFSPAHKVVIDSFYMDKHEVTNSEYLKFCKATGHRLPEFW